MNITFFVNKITVKVQSAFSFKVLGGIAFHLVSYLFYIVFYHLYLDSYECLWQVICFCFYATVHNSS